MRALPTALLVLLAASAARAAPPDAPVPLLRSDAVFNGVATTKGGRTFLPFQRQQPGAGIEVGEWVDGAPKPYPDARWNAYAAGGEAARSFVGVNALRVGPDGRLWIVDRGATSMGGDVVPGGAKVVVVDLDTDTVSRVIPLDAVVGRRSFVDDIRFNGGHAYLTDAGQPGLIVIDLEGGRMWRALDGDRSVTAERPLMAEGRPVVDARGKPVVIHADQLEVSPDGATLFFQPCSGPMFRIGTRFLDDPDTPDDERRKHVAPFADTPSTGGTAMDAAGNIFLSDVDHLRVLKIAPDGTSTTVAAGPELDWVDAMWIDDGGRLLMPAAQLDRTAGMNGGVDAVRFPTVVYALPVGSAPLRR